MAADEPYVLVGDRCYTYAAYRRAVEDVVAERLDRAFAGATPRQALRAVARLRFSGAYESVRDAALRRLLAGEGTVPGAVASRIVGRFPSPAASPADAV